ncbi:hypothetical protein [Roseiconus lacunae]|uniref:hypothetical protein n=1 Tax=Roseiconus lacunae TaxID=2605694 RepID=UPI001E3BD6C1|nr:hypothetical protein [Roseiconus lacunae]MCD0458486.1 hypothetical protein [Roseiconus lacunae]
MFRRLPVFSLITAVVAAAVLLTSAFAHWDIPETGQGALGFVILASSLADAVRLSQTTRKSRSGQGGADDDSEALALLKDDELRQWLEEQTDQLRSESKRLADRSLALQQWMQFPDAIAFRSDSDHNGARNRTDSRVDDRDRLPKEAFTIAVDPLASHDQALMKLIDAKTRELFENIKNDTYREKTDAGYAFKTEQIRDDLFQLVSDVAAIYRPDDPAPLLRTNVEAISRATGRASLRLLVAIESLPVSLATYDFQSIYKLVTQAVKTFGLYKSAKPYLDVASTMWLAGRIVISTNPITMAAWWAASKATTYGASKLGQHVLDQQAVGLIRQLVEIVAIEVASIYSPMVRYRDVHWVYGVELVHLASQLHLSDAAKLEAMRQLAVLNFKDEYGRVALMRQLANGASSRPAQYRPAQSLSPADRTIVAEKLEEFLLTHVLTGAKLSRNNAEKVEQWQVATGERLEIQFRAGQVDADEKEQRQRAVWALASFALEHLGDEPDTLEATLRSTQVWQGVHSDTQVRYLEQLIEQPPYLYHPPEIAPKSALAAEFLSDLASLAARLGGMIADVDSAKEAATRLTVGQIFEMPRQSRESVLRVTAYFLRSDPEAVVGQCRKLRSESLIGRQLPPEVVESGAWLWETSGQPIPVPLFHQAKWTSQADDQSAPKTAAVIRLGDLLVCYAIDPSPANLEIQILSCCPRAEVRINKLAGYIRSDCELVFPDRSVVVLPGSTFGSYDEWFAGLVNA